MRRLAQMGGIMTRLQLLAQLQQLAPIRPELEDLVQSHIHNPQRTVPVHSGHVGHVQLP